MDAQKSTLKLISKLLRIIQYLSSMYTVTFLKLGSKATLLKKVIKQHCHNTTLLNFMIQHHILNENTRHHIIK
jgi:hypothetical protein